jgi:TolB protein
MAMLTNRRFRAAITLLGTAAFFAAAMLGCQQFSSPSPFPSTASPTAPPLHTLVPTFAPGEHPDPMILSVEENGYAHLFLFDAVTSALTRLTYGQWSDITPSLSPDGKTVAFASNRGGHWDLYTLDLRTGQSLQLMNTPEYDSSPTWSPDLAWIAYETYHDGSLDIAILSLTDPASAPILLADTAASEYSPAWAPNGREIAFVSASNGNADIWLADLNKTDQRFSNISNSPASSESHPVWSPDGTHLAWASSSQSTDYDGVYLWEPGEPEKGATWVGNGDWPAWNSAGDEIASMISTANQDLLTAYKLNGQPVLLPASLPGQLRGLAWPKLDLSNGLPDSLRAAAAETPEALTAQQITPEAGVPSKRWYVVPLQDVQAPFPQIHALADQPFMALRKRVIADAGWDALASLENAYTPLTTALDPGLAQDWLYTGRAFAINSLMVNAGWMAVAREDVGTQTYWRLYLRTQNQDGSQGAPIESPPWDLNARYALDPKKYEAGGDYSAVPAGYWIDLTSLAAAYGWTRLPALPNWRNYFSGARFTEFALTGGLDWYTAMLELYPSEALLTATAVLPPTATPSRTPIPTSTPVPTRTPGPSPTASNTPPPSSTPLPPPPTATLLPSATPPTIIPTFPSPTP